MIPVAILIAMLSWRASRHPALDARTRRAWRIVSGSLMMHAAGVATWLLLGRPPVSLGDAGRLALFPGMLWAMFVFPAGRRTRDDRRRFRLDAATVVLAGAMVIWYVLLAQAATNGTWSGGRTLVQIAASLGDLLLLLGIAAILLRRSSPVSRRALVWLAAGAITWCVADVAFAYRVIAGTASAAPPVLVGIRILAGGMWAMSALVQHADASASRSPESPETESGIIYTSVPYLAVALGYGLLLVAAAQSAIYGTAFDTPELGIVLGAVALTAIVAARQWVSAQEAARLQGERVARREEDRFRSLVQHSSDMIVVVDEHGMVRFVSPSVQRTLGSEPETMIGQRLADWVHSDDRASIDAAIANSAAQRGTTAPTSVRMRHVDGDWRSLECVGTNMLDDPTVHGIVLNARDVTERARLEAELTRQAFHDSLTNLANRALFRDRVSHALSREERQREGVAVLFLDLDDFKKVNDSFGHGEGDLLLVTVAERLLNATRGCDTVARLGGDEFAVLLEKVRTDQDVITVAERIMESLRHPIALETQQVRISASIGLARARVEDGTEELLRNADVAMYKAKQRRNGGYEMFAPEMHAAVVNRMQLESDIRDGLERREFHLYYQPIVELGTGTVSGVEALLRWQHPTRGMVPPAAFIPLAEETGLIIPLGRWVLKEACRQAAAWIAPGPAENGGGETPAEPLPIAITVNVSGRHLQHPDIVGDVAAALASSGLPPHCLILEITESAIMRDTATTLERLHALKTLGIRLAIDDFGTGYSSLSYLQRFPVDILKIDKAFVDGVARGGQNAALARTILALGEMLSLRCVAEGIEDEDQRRHLRALGCSLGQGFLFARPLKPADVPTLIQQRGVCGDDHEVAFTAGARR